MPIIIAIVGFVLLLFFAPQFTLGLLGKTLFDSSFWIFILIFVVLYGVFHGIASLFKNPEKEKKKKAAEIKAKQTANNRKRRLLQTELGRHTARMVQKHLDSIKKPDEKFWTYWSCFKDDGKWKGELTRGDFAALSTAIPLEEPPAPAQKANKVAETKPINDKERRVLQVECAQHNASKVLKHLHSLHAPDDKYYAYQSCFQDGKWAGILKESDFQLTPPALPKAEKEKTDTDKKQEDKCYEDYYADQPNKNATDVNTTFRPGRKVRIHGGHWDGREGVVRGLHFDRVVVALKDAGQIHEESIPQANCQLITIPNGTKTIE